MKKEAAAEGVTRKLGEIEENSKRRRRRAARGGGGHASDEEIGSANVMAIMWAAQRQPVSKAASATMA